MDNLDEAVARVVASAPPLSPGQLARLRELLPPLDDLCDGPPMSVEILRDANGETL